jgi:hypothetical protein
VTHINDQPNQHIGRRDLFRVLAGGAVAVGTNTAPLVAVAAETTNAPNKLHKARYQATSPEVQMFYRYRNA